MVAYAFIGSIDEEGGRPYKRGRPPSSSIHGRSAITAIIRLFDIALNNVISGTRASDTSAR
eukprot:scaffold513117_cov18-Prasinocladus_malaysianus.AAC.1